MKNFEIKSTIFKNQKISQKIKSKHYVHNLIIEKLKLQSQNKLFKTKKKIFKTNNLKDKNQKKNYLNKKNKPQKKQSN